MKHGHAKRYQEGGETEYDEIGAVSRGLKGVEAQKYGIAAGARQEAPEAPSATEEDMSPKTFKQAFAEARRAGERTFTWRGKKYTTELAKPKAKAKAEEPDESMAETARLARQAKSAPAEKRGMGPKLTFLTPERLSQSREAMRRSREGMKSGGSVKKYASGGSVSASKRADGCAIRGKTRGKVY